MDCFYDSLPKKIVPWVIQGNHVALQDRFRIKPTFWATHPSADSEPNAACCYYKDKKNNQYIFCSMDIGGGIYRYDIRNNVWEKFLDHPEEFGDWQVIDHRGCIDPESGKMYLFGGHESVFAILDIEIRN